MPPTKITLPHICFQYWFLSPTKGPVQFQNGGQESPLSPTSSRQALLLLMYSYWSDFGESSSVRASSEPTSSQESHLRARPPHRPQHVYWMQLFQESRHLNTSREAVLQSSGQGMKASICPACLQQSTLHCTENITCDDMWPQCFQVVFVCQIIA